MKKQNLHDIRGKHKFGNDLVESPESGTEHETKEESGNHMGMIEPPFTTADKPTEERNKRFIAHKANCEKANSLM